MKRKNNAGPAAALILAVFALILVWERSRGYLEPQQPQVTTAALLGHGLLEGRSLYSDLWDPHPPALPLSYAFAESLGGYGPYSIFLLNLLIAGGLLGALTLAGWFYGGMEAGLTAAALWTLVSGDLALWANQPSAEGFANLFIAGALCALLSVKSSEANKRAFIAAGVCLALASLYKLSALALIFLWAALLSKNPGGQPSPRKARTLAWMLAPAAGIWVLVFIYFGLAGAFADFWGAVFSFNLFKLGQSAAAPGGLLNIWPAAMKIGVPFLLTAFLGSVLGFSKKTYPWVLSLAYGLWVLVETSASSFEAASYQCWLPPLVLGAAWGLFEVRGWIQTWNPKLAFGPTALLILFAFCAEWPHYQMWASDWSKLKAGDGAVETYNLARNLDNVLKPGETFYEWGDETQLYYLTRRDPPSGVFTCDPLMAGPLAESLSLRVAGDLRRHPPDLFLFNRGEALGDWGQNPVLTALEGDYVLLKKVPASEGMIFFARKGSPLAARLGASGG